MVALTFAGAAASDASACDASRRSAASGPRSGRPPLIIGDSTLILAAPYLGRRGLAADAHGCRQFSQGIAMLAARRRAGTLPRLSILALGANGPVDSGAIARALRIAGRDRVLGLATPRNLRSSAASMRRAARRHRDRVLLLDWARFSRAHGRWFAGDGLHVNAAGARAFAVFVARRAAAYLPPPRPLHVPRLSRGTQACGTIHRFHRALRVNVLRGTERITCKRARAVARRPPSGRLAGWRIYDWRGAKPGPWREVYARRDRRVLVGTIQRRRGIG